MTESIGGIIIETVFLGLLSIGFMMFGLKIYRNPKSLEAGGGDEYTKWFRESEIDKQNRLKRFRSRGCLLLVLSIVPTIMFLLSIVRLFDVFLGR